MASYTPLRLEESDGAALLRVRALAGASRNEIRGVRDGELIVRVTAPAERGRANRAIERALCAVLGVRRSSIALVAGATAVHKRFRVDGLTRDEVLDRLRPLLEG